MKTLPACDIDFLVRQTRMMLASYRHWKGAGLWPEDRPDDVLAREVFFAPFALCSAGIEKNPVLNYGNQKALDLWEMDWKTFTRTPGQKTAEPMEREARSRFLETVRTQGFVDDYRGVRISSTGRRFEILQAIVWNLMDEKGRYAGQAAWFSRWKNLPP